MCTLAEAADCGSAQLDQPLGGELDKELRRAATSEHGLQLQDGRVHQDRNSVIQANRRGASNWVAGHTQDLVPGSEAKAPCAQVAADGVLVQLVGAAQDDCDIALGLAAEEEGFGDGT